MATESRVPPPPRLDPDPRKAVAQIARYIEDLHQQIINGEILQASQQSVVETVDVGSLPNPATSTVATAQQTANDAYQAAVAAQVLANGIVLRTGSIVVSGASTTGTTALDPPVAAATYIALLQTRAFSGSPAAGARTVTLVTKAVAQLDIAVSAAPGVGTSVTFDFVLIAAEGGA